MSASEGPSQVHDWQIMEIDESCCMAPTDADVDRGTVVSMETRNISQFAPLMAN